MSNGRIAPARTRASVGLAALGLFVAAGPASALEELKGEKKALATCERQLCAMLVLKERKGPDLACDLTKTWGRKTIKDAEPTELTWGFGDARCTVRLNVSRSEIVHAVTAGEAKFQLHRQIIHCVVEENGTPQNVNVVVSPKLEFANGRAIKMWINLVSTDGPGSVTQLLHFGAKLHDNLGLFHSALLKSVNSFIYKSCPKVHAKADEVATQPKAPKPAKKTARSAPTPEAAKTPEPAPPPADSPKKPE